MNYRTSDAGVRLIMRFEGLRLNAYQDQVGVWTIGYGSTHLVVPGMSITQDEAERLLRSDLRDAEDCVNRKVGPALLQHQFDAVVSFVFNLGCRAFSGSTLLRLLNAGDLAGAAAEFPKWNRAGGVPREGLTRRRLAEQTLFLS